MVFLQLMDIKKSTERDAGRAGSNGLMDQVGQDDIWGLWRVVDVEIFGDLRGGKFGSAEIRGGTGGKTPPQLAQSVRVRETLAWAWGSQGEAGGGRRVSESASGGRVTGSLALPWQLDQTNGTPE